MDKNSYLLIIVGGLGDTGKSLEKMISWWKFFGFRLVTFDTKWRTNETFRQKLNRLDQIVKISKNKHQTVSLLGTSAGGSLAFNIFLNNPNVIYKAVNICGRIKIGDLSGFRNLENMSKTSSSFSESVKQIDVRTKETNQKVFSRLMNVRPYWDELVPRETTFLNGAVNYNIYSIEHMLSIFLALTLFSRKIIKFLE